MRRGRVCVTCRQFPEEGVGRLGPRLKGAQGRVSQDPRLLETEHNRLEMGQRGPGRRHPARPDRRSSQAQAHTDMGSHIPAITLLATQ